MCTDLRDYKSFPKGLSIKFNTYLFIYLHVVTWLFIFSHINESGKSLEKKLSQFSSVLAANIVVKKICQRIFTHLCFFSAVLERDSEALFKVRKGSGKDNSFIPVFITKHKFYINSLSKGSLTLFPFPMLN